MDQLKEIILFVSWIAEVDKPKANVHITHWIIFWIKMKLVKIPVDRCKKPIDAFVSLTLESQIFVNTVAVSVHIWHISYKNFTQFNYEFKIFYGYVLIIM